VSTVAAYTYQSKIYFVFKGSLGIPYQILTYEVDSADLAAERAAQKVRLAPKQVFKTLVVRGGIALEFVLPLTLVITNLLCGRCLLQQRIVDNRLGLLSNYWMLYTVGQQNEKAVRFTWEQ
jgi:hypothetical protein